MPLTIHHLLAAALLIPFVAGSLLVLVAIATIALGRKA